jgi:hypothetical protein
LGFRGNVEIPIESCHPEEPWRRRTCFPTDFSEIRFFATLRMTLAL